MSTDVMTWLPQRVDVDPGGCWVWTAGLSWSGYGDMRGKVAERSGTRIAHRVVYLALVGEIPDGHDLDHLCRNRACVNPDHLEPVTRSENLRRSPLVGKSNADQTECANGHSLSGENLYVRPDRPNRRQCRTCMRAATQRWRERSAA